MGQDLRWGIACCFSFSGGCGDERKGGRVGNAAGCGQAFRSVGTYAGEQGHLE